MAPPASRGAPAVSSGRLIETFNTHRMSDRVVQAVATARDRELAEVMNAIRQSIGTRRSAPQHMVLYGERGAGKSFLLRMVEIELERLAREEGLPVVAALLPEEHYNIRRLPQLLTAIVARIEGAPWSSVQFTFDPRPQIEAWTAAVRDLDRALDARFGAGRGVVVAMVENFDVLAKDLFGSEPASDKPNASRRAVEQGAAEQLLRKLLNSGDSRLLLIAAATGTVDQDYERPLFHAFKPIDLEMWTADDCIAYFNRRRALQGQGVLTLHAEARVRAIARFIGGNPRLAQLLGDVLESQDAHSIASVLDELSDHLADYYRRRLDDLSPQAAALVDALIRGGEPCTQSALAQRVAAPGQSQVADAFSQLIQGRVLSAESQRGGSGTLYQVRDRLFVHFYRRRYGGPGLSEGLAPVAELLERFFTDAERQSQARRLLEAGEWADAQVLVPAYPGVRDKGSGYRDRADRNHGLDLLFAAARIDPASAPRLAAELRDTPQFAVRRWGHEASQSADPVARAGMLALEALALARRGLGSEAWSLLLSSSRDAGENVDARIILETEAALYCWWHVGSKEGAVHSARIGSLSESATLPVTRYLSLYWAAFTGQSAGNWEAADKAFAAAVSIAVAQGFVASESAGRAGRSAVLSRRYQWADALAEADRALAAGESLQRDDLVAEASCARVEPLQRLGRGEESLRAGQLAIEVSRRAGDHENLFNAEIVYAWAAIKSAKQDEALSVYDHAIELAKRHDLSRLPQALRLKAELLEAQGQYDEAMSLLKTALKDTQEETDESLLARYALLRTGKWTETSDVVEHLEKAARYLDQSGRWLSFDVVSAGIAAVARSSAWTTLLERAPAILEKRPNLGPIFGDVGVVWADQARRLGRATFYASVAEQLPHIVGLMSMLPVGPRAGDSLVASRQLHFIDLLSGVARNVDDPGLLDDLADLLSRTFSVESGQWPERLRAFAAVRSASDKERALQQLDPDLATTIRTVLDLPDPSDLLAQRGRRRGR